MKRMFLVVLVAVMVTFSAVNIFAAEEKVVASSVEEDAGWTPTAEVTLVGRTGYVSQYAGSAGYKKPLFSQSVTIGADKDGNGFYAMAENFSSSEQEARETDFYVGFYVEKLGLKIDGGYGYYWIREHKAIDIHALYAEITFPSSIWGIVPLIKVEYDFAQKASEGEDLNGLMYYASLKREFKIHERVTVTPEIGLGGNTGLYGLPADNVAYAREKLDVSFSIVEHLKLRLTLQTQQNLGRQEGIAKDTDRLFVSAAIVMTF